MSFWAVGANNLNTYLDAALCKMTITWLTVIGCSMGGAAIVASNTFVTILALGVIRAVAYTSIWVADISMVVTFTRNTPESRKIHFNTCTGFKDVVMNFFLC